MKHRVLGLLPLTIVAVAVLSEPACAQPPQTCEFLTGLKIDNVNLFRRPRSGDHGSPVPLPRAADTLGRRSISKFACPFRTGTASSSWPVAAVSAALSTATAWLHQCDELWAAAQLCRTTMDTGHWGLSVPTDAGPYNNRLAEIDWGSRAVTETAKVTKAIIRAYYGEPQKKSYFVGCSTGGRMAAMEAQRYP